MEAAKWRAGKHPPEGETHPLKFALVRDNIMMFSCFLTLYKFIGISAGEIVFGEIVCGVVQVVVLWVGTNNYEHTAEQVAGGILAIAELLRSHLPKAKIIVLVSTFSVC